MDSEEPDFVPDHLTNDVIAEFQGHNRPKGRHALSIKSTLPSVQKLQTALHDKAKGSPSFRFYALFDKVYRADVLTFA